MIFLQQIEYVLYAYADLSTGFLNEKERTITCPLHMSSFSLKDGVPLNLPAEDADKDISDKDRRRLNLRLDRLVE